MDNDRMFAVYALTLTSGVASVITASVLAGFTTLPSMGLLLGHLAMSLAFRGAYKSLAGFDWIYRAAEIAGMITNATVPTDVVAEGPASVEATG